MLSDLLIQGKAFVRNQLLPSVQAYQNARELAFATKPGTVQTAADRLKELKVAAGKARGALKNGASGTNGGTATPTSPTFPPRSTTPDQKSGVGGTTVPRVATGAPVTNGGTVAPTKPASGTSSPSGGPSATATKPVDVPKTTVTGEVVGAEAKTTAAPNLEVGEMEKQARVLLSRLSSHPNLAELTARVDAHVMENNLDGLKTFVEKVGAFASKQAAQEEGRAAEEAKEKDVEMRGLIARAMAVAKKLPTTPEKLQAFKDLITSAYSEGNLDRLAEIAKKAEETVLKWDAAAAKKKAEEEAAANKKEEEEAAAKKKAEEAAAKKKAEEEAAAKKKADEEAAAKKKADEEAAAKKKAAEEAAAKKAAATASSNPSEHAQSPFARNFHEARKRPQDGRKRSCRGEGEWKISRGNGPRNRRNQTRTRTGASRPERSDRRQRGGDQGEGQTQSRYGMFFFLL